MDKDSISKRERRVVDDKYNRGSKYLDDLELNEAIHFCYRWMNMPGSLEVLKHFDKMMGNQSVRSIKVKRVKDEPVVDTGIKRVKIKKVV